MRFRILPYVWCCLLATHAASTCAGPLQSDAAAYTDGNSFQWHGSAFFSSLFISNLKLLQGSVDWAVYAPGAFPSGYTGYTPTAGEYTYAYEIFLSGSAGQSLLPITDLLVHVDAGVSEDQIGGFTGNGGNGAISGTAIHTSVLEATNAHWTFTGLGPAATAKSVGLAFSSPLGPHLVSGSMVFDTSSFPATPQSMLPSPFKPPVPGDYDGNGTVGPEDYTIWKTNFGSTSQLAADGNGNKVVDAADYTIWRDHLGQTSGSGAGATASSAAVPEPSTLVMLILAATGGCLRPGRAA